MNTRFTKHLIFAAIICVAPCSIVLAQSIPDAQSANTDNSTTQSAASQASSTASPELPLVKQSNWYASYGFARQQYAPSDIHVTQPGLGNNFTVHQAAAGDDPSDLGVIFNNVINGQITDFQDAIRVGRFMNPEKTFAIELSIDHSKYNTNIGQTAYVSGTGTLGGQQVNHNIVLSSQVFDYELHNGLNHIMVNGVWLHHLFGPEQKPGDLQLISRVGAGILLPHAETTVSGMQPNLGPKDQNICCFQNNDWWQLNGWTTGVEVGVRYRILESMYLELTAKEAYGVLHHVPVYQGTSDQTIWMTEEVLTAGFLF
jgi:hypothetical protein